MATFSSFYSRDSPPPLRPYQQEALDRLLAYGGRAALVVMATGLGKTRVYTEYIRREVELNDHRCLILSHREELVRQPLTYLSDLPCGIELGEQHADPLRCKVISASVQSLIGRLHKYNPREFDLIIVDEAHHSAARTYREIFQYFPSAVIVGFTATAIRSDGIGLGCVFSDILAEYNTLYGIQHGYLCPIEAHQVTLKYKMGSVKICEDTGDFDANDVARVMSGTAAGVVEAFEKYARGQTLIFAASISEANDIVALLNKKAGKRTAALITGMTPNRSRLLEAFQLGALKTLVNYGVLTEGVDLPCTETVVIARPIAHTNIGLYAQIVGRGLRLHPGKTACVVVDCVGISDSPICTAATLIGRDLPAPRPEKEPTPPAENDPAPLNVLTGDQIPDTMIQKEKPVDVESKGVGSDMHGVAWISLKDGGYLLAIPNMTYRLSKPLPDGTVFVRKNKSCSKSPVPVQFAFDYVYQDLKQRHAKDRHVWDKQMRRHWDGQPITAQQVQLLHELAPDLYINTKTMTRGDASSMIQLLLYKPDERGAKGGTADA